MGTRRTGTGKARDVRAEILLSYYEGDRSLLGLDVLSFLKSLFHSPFQAEMEEREGRREEREERVVWLVLFSFIFFSFLFFSFFFLFFFFFLKKSEEEGRDKFCERTPKEKRKERKREREREKGSKRKREEREEREREREERERERAREEGNESS